MMTRLRIRRIDCACEDAREVIQELRRQLSPQGDVVSPRGRARTVEVFGEPHDAKSPASSLHSNVEPSSVAWNAKVADVDDTVPTGPESMSVSGAVVSSESRTTCGS